MSLELPDPAEFTWVQVDQLPLIMWQLVKGCSNKVLRTDPERLLELQGETIERLLARLLAGRFPEADHLAVPKPHVLRRPVFAKEDTILIAKTGFGRV